MNPHIHQGGAKGKSSGRILGSFHDAIARFFCRISLLDLVGGLLVVGAESFDVGFSLPPEREGIHPVCPFSEKCHGV